MTEGEIGELLRTTLDGLGDAPDPQPADEPTRDELRQRMAAEANEHRSREDVRAWVVCWAAEARHDAGILRDMHQHAMGWEVGPADVDRWVAEDVVDGEVMP